MKRRNITATTVSGVEEDLTKCIASIENGTYSALMNINEGLVRTRERKVACADKRRKLNIKSINELFKYDLRDLQVQYEVKILPCTMLDWAFYFYPSDHHHHLYRHLSLTLDSY